MHLTLLHWHLQLPEWLQLGMCVGARELQLGNPVLVTSSGTEKERGRWGNVLMSGPFKYEKGGMSMTHGLEGPCSLCAR